MEQIAVKAQGRFFKLERTQWVQLYTAFFSVLGIAIFTLALQHLPADRASLGAFVLLASLAEFVNVELFIGARGSRVSVAGIVAIASVLVFGPLAGALVSTPCALISPLAERLRTGKSTGERASLIRRVLFNTGMLATATTGAGLVYLVLGGDAGRIMTWTSLIALILAAGANEMFNLVILLGVLRLQTGQAALRIWNQNFRWAFPIGVISGVVGGGLLALAYQMFGVLGLVVFFLPLLTIGYSFRLYVNNSKEYVNQLETMNQALDEANLGLLETFGAIIDAYDIYTYGHSAQVSIYAGAIAQEMGLSKEQQAMIVKAALVHDIGKIGITDNIIGKQGPLTEKERLIMQRHPVIGADIIRRTKGLQDLAPLVRQHHERWDGKGYPAGLAGEEILLEARVIALADALEAMCSDRPYRPTRKFELVMEEVRKSSGVQFDPQVVNAFFSFLEKKGPQLFQNTAAEVDENLSASGLAHLLSTRYLKKGMLADVEPPDTAGSAADAGHAQAHAGKSQTESGQQQQTSAEPASAKHAGLNGKGS